MLSLFSENPHGVFLYIKPLYGKTSFIKDALQRPVLEMSEYSRAIALRIDARQDALELIQCVMVKA